MKTAILTIAFFLFIASPALASTNPADFEASTAALWGQAVPPTSYAVLDDPQIEAVCDPLHLQPFAQVAACGALGAHYMWFAAWYWTDTASDTERCQVHAHEFGHNLGYDHTVNDQGVYRWTNARAEIVMARAPQYCLDAFFDSTPRGEPVEDVVHIGDALRIRSPRCNSRRFKQRQRRISRRLGRPGKVFYLRYRFCRKPYRIRHDRLSQDPRPAPLTTTCKGGAAKEEC